MNKTLMLVICDFLLLSMLALARFDPPKEAPVTTLNATASSASAEAELISLLEESLESELESRSNLSENLAETRESLQEKARLLAERESALANTQKSLEQKVLEAEQLAASKASVEEDKQALVVEKTQVESERLALAEKLEATRMQLESANSERVTLTQNVGQLREESSVAKERLSQTEETLIAREIAIDEREVALKAAQEETQRLAKQSEQLNRQLEIAHAERSLLEQNLTQEKQAKQQLQLEKAQAIAHAERLTENVSELGQGVTQLAQTSVEIKQEMDDARPRTMSEIFTRFQKNRASILFTSTEKPLIGSPVTRNYESKSILISDTGGSYLVTHTADTPFAFSKNANSILAAKLEVTLGGRTFPINQVAFLSADPRLIFIPLPKKYVDQSQLETFELALQPGRWEEAVLVKNDESNFGRTGFRRLTSSERFLKMERPALGELFADFASSRGDLAFSKNSQFIGVLTDTKHAVVIDAFLASGIASLGAGFNNADNAATIERLKDRVRKLPTEVQ
jgi:acyl transferase domain-containing protein